MFGARIKELVRNDLIEFADVVFGQYQIHFLRFSRVEKPGATREMQKLCWAGAEFATDL